MNDKNNTDAIHIALSVYDPRGTYSRHAGVVMASIFENTKSPVCVHILHDETLTEDNRARFIETAEPYGQRVEFHDVSPLIERMGNEIIEMAQGRGSVGKLFRLTVQDLLPVDKVIYLDCDIVVNMDIRELWDISLENYSIAGVLDRPIHKRFSLKALRLKCMGCDRKTYINSGVLFMNLALIKTKYKLFQESIAWFQRCQHYSDLVDQDMINSCFRGDIKIIDSQFNNCSAHLKSGFRSELSEVSGCILHAIITLKPWETLRNSALDRLYWKAFLKTSWGRLTPDELADFMLEIAYNSETTHRHTSQCYKKIFYRLWQDIFCNEIVSIIGFLLKVIRDRCGCFLRRRKARD
ncbi:MAG: glycosyltransferase family 8 protein [Synergistaceae bacterium]|nr:glycosyltransferase family 8 protein [Synergistaceae bacterium]